MSREISVKAFACDTCSKVYSTLIYAVRLDIAEQAARSAADECCAPRLCECGASIERQWTACATCRKRNKLRRATVIDAARYTGPVFSDECDGDWGEGYSSDLPALHDWCSGNGRPIPAYVHPCDPTPFRLDACGILESALDDHHDDAADQVVDEGQLARFLDMWNAKQTFTSYYPDNRLVIVLDQAAFDALVADPAPEGGAA